jgi:remodeling and spacing factor 1
VYNIETAELKRQRQQLAEITEQNIIQERKKNKAERASKSKEKTLGSKVSSESGSDESEDSSDDEPLKYKLRKRNQTAASYRFNEYDDLINSAIKRDEIKGAGNLGRGKDISTIIEAGDEEKKDEEKAEDGEKAEKESKPTKDEDGESSGSDVIRPKKIFKKKKKKLNNLDASSEEERVSDADFKGTSSSDSEVDEEDLSMSSVSESSLDMPSKKKKGRNSRTLRTREKRTDRRFINDNSNSDSDDEPLIKAKRSKKKDSDEEEFDVNDDDDDEGSLAEEIDSEDLCDDTETDSSSEGNWPKKKKKRVASYDTKPRKALKKKDENEDKAFRAGISKKKVLKKSENESEGSGSDNEKGKRKTRGKKLLYLIEDDLDSSDSDGIKPGVKRPETPPEEREMFFKKQEEIKRMLAAKDTEAAKKLAAPTIEPIHIGIEKPKSPSLPFSNEPASLSTIPKNVIESAKALDTDYNRIAKPIAFGSQSKGCEDNLQSNDMNEEELARMMEEEDFAQHQLKLAGEAIARKKLLDLEAKEGDFAAYSKVKEIPPVVETKKRSRKPKSAEKSNQEFSPFAKALSNPQGPPPILTSSPMPPLISSNLSQMPPRPLMQQHPPPPSLIANMMQQHQHHQQPHVPTNMMNERPSVLSSFMARPDMHPQHLKIHQPIPPEAFNSKIQPLPPQQQFDESEEKKKGRRKKFTPLRTDLPEGNISKLAKLDPPSVIQSAPNSSDRVEDKNKGKLNGAQQMILNLIQNYFQFLDQIFLNSQLQHLHKYSTLPLLPLRLSLHAFFNHNGQGHILKVFPFKILSRLSFL